MTKDLFEIIHTYSRADALADGEQIDVTEKAKEVNILYPTFLTRAVFDSLVTVPSGLVGQDESGRLWDILWMLRNAIRHNSRFTYTLKFSLHVRNDNPRLVQLVAVCGPLDIDDATPAITIMMPGED